MGICKDCKYNIEDECKYDDRELINTKWVDCGLYEKRDKKVKKCMKLESGKEMK